MQATRLIDVGDIRTIDVPEPQPGPGDIVIQVEAAGICGTDRHLYKGEFPSRPDTTLGHEFSGLVVDAGGSGLKPGTRVTCDPSSASIMTSASGNTALARIASVTPSVSNIRNPFGPS